MEIVVVSVILVVVAAVALPNLAGYYNNKRALETVSILTELGRSLNNNNVLNGDFGFLQTVLRYPLRLSHMNVKITTSDRQCSAAVYTAAQVAAWRLSPPYSRLNIQPLKGVATPLGWIQDTVVKGTQTGTFGSSQKGWIELHLDSLSTTDVEMIDLLVDEAIDSTAGVIRDSTARGTATSLNLHLLRFLIAAPAFKRSGAGADSMIGCF